MPDVRMDRHANLNAARLHELLASRASAQEQNDKAAKLYHIAAMEYARAGEPFLPESVHCEEMGEIYGYWASVK